MFISERIITFFCKRKYFFLKKKSTFFCRKKLLDMDNIDPRGVRGGTALFFVVGKSVFEKHPNLGHVWGIIWGMSGACLGQHLGHVWGIIWGMSGAS